MNYQLLNKSARLIIINVNKGYQDSVYLLPDGDAVKVDKSVLEIDYVQALISDGDVIARKLKDDDKRAKGGKNG